MKLNLGIRWLVITATMMLITGCTTARVNWNARVGLYNYDQVVIELGPPDKQAKLSDGQTIAEWVSRYSTSSSVIVGPGYYRSPGGMGIAQTIPNYYESHLRLTFNTNNVLSAWSKK